MKKLLAILLVSVITIMSLTSCSSGNTTDNQSSKGTTEKLRVILLVPGTLGDKSFFDSANNGLKLISEKYACEVKALEMGLDVDKYVPAFEDVIDEGWDIIITGGQNVAAPMVEMASKYPDQKFMIFDESVDYSNGQSPNVYSMTYRQNEGSYLAGVLAASVTSSGMANANDKKQIGFAGGYDIPLINDFLVGYIEGALSVDPDVKVGIGYMSSFTDAAKGKEVGVALYNDGVDVVFQAGGGAGLGVLDAAKEMNKYAIGTDSDQSELFKSDVNKANAILSSVLKRVDNSILSAVGRHIDGTLKYGTTGSYGMKEGCIELIDNTWYKTNVTQAIRDKVSETYKKLQSGEIKVTSALNLTNDQIASMKAKVAK